MPGAHIYKISQFNWPKQQKEPILTVPGSYWLCHKTNIYKFTFRYHCSVRNTKDFAYGKELMKIIRRIIKSQPCQGQQFCTKHILVTYNHTSWTRQDKMFAMLKFRDHTQISTAPRAVVLTVKVFENDTISYENTEQKKHTKKEYSSQDIENNGTISIESSNANELKISCDDAVKHINNINNFNLNYNSNDLSLLTSINNSDTIDKSKIIKLNRRCLTGKSINIETKNIHKNEDCSISWKEAGIKKYQCHNNTEISPLLNQYEFDETEQEKNKVQRISTTSDDINSTNDEGVVESANLPYQYLIEKEIENEKKKIIPLSEVNKSITTHMKDEFSINSTKKSETKHLQKTIKENYKYKDRTKKGKLETIQNKEKEHTKNIQYISIDLEECENMDNERITTNSSNCKSIGELQKNIDADDNTLKSSNITDLIMKGCMFTIQQDKDSVSVLEQETKLEVDEVLENSEKVETKEGEKCLLNSSLLKLENLVTMIEAPEETITNNYTNKFAHDNNRLLHSALLTRDCNAKQHIAVSTNVMGSSVPSLSSQNIPILNKLPDKSSTENDKHKLETIINNTVTKQIAKEVENDKAEEISIIAELDKRNSETANSIVEAPSSSERFYIKDDTYSGKLQNNCLQTNFLLDTHNTVFEDNINNSNSKVVETSTDASLNHMSNIPRIISNEIITVDQMPSRLQKIIKKKLLESNTSANRKHQSNSQGTRLYDAELELFNESINLEKKCIDTEFVSNSTTKCTDALSMCSNVNVTKETTMSCEKRKRPHDYDAESNNDQVQNEKMISSIQQKTYSPVDKTERHKKRKIQDCKYDAEKKAEKPAHISRIVKQKYSTMPNKLQDITEEFYQDLIQHHIHNENVDCESHRQTRESFYLDTKAENENIRIEMLKFIEDITRGVKVVIKRMSTKSISNIVGKDSPLAYIN